MTQKFPVLTLKGHRKFMVKLNFGFQFSLPKNAEIFSSKQEGQNLKIHWLVLSKRQIARSKNWHSSLLSSHWGDMKSFSKIWILARRILSNISLFFKRKIRGVRGVIMPTFCCYKNICKLRTQKPQARFKWNLPDISTISTPSFSKKWGRRWLGVGGGASKI